MSDILLRNVAESDLTIIFEQMSDPESCAMAAVPSRDKKTFEAHWTKIMVDETIVIRVIEVNGQVAGHLVSFVIENEREVGYWLGREFWGRGIATEALRQFLGMVTTRPLFAHTAKHNAGSKRVLEKCGFKVIREEKYMNKRNEEVDELVLKLN